MGITIRRGCVGEYTIDVSMRSRDINHPSHDGSFFKSRTPLGCGTLWGWMRSDRRTVRGLKPGGWERLSHISKIVSCLFLLAPVGCHCRSAPQPITSPGSLALEGLSTPVVNEVLKAEVAPPIGWKPEPLKSSPTHRHQVWLSPTGDTAYGVIYFDLPLPIGVDLALWGFLTEMKKTEGEANLLFRRNDLALPGLRFVAEGGLYTIRCTLRVDGFHGWVVYAGTLRSRPVNSAELKKAELARDQTRTGNNE